LVFDEKRGKIIRDYFFRGSGGFSAASSILHRSWREAEFEKDLYFYRKLS
jgi:hypothetical protein